MNFEPTDYQFQFMDATGFVVMMAGRQTGKTEAIARETRDRLLDGQIVALPAPNHRMAMTLGDRIRHVCVDDGLRSTKTKFEIGDGVAHLIPLSTMQYNTFGAECDTTLGYGSADAILVDESNFVEEERLFEIVEYARMTDGQTDVKLAATPRPYTRTITEVWADSSPFWETIHVPSREAPFIDDEALNVRKRDTVADRFSAEFEAEYKQEDYYKRRNQNT